MQRGKGSVLALIAFGLFGGSAGAQQEAIDMRLEDMGFVMRAVTPQQFDRLRSLPSHKFVARTVSGRRYYLFSDPDLCKCVFLGNEAAMQSYRDLVAGAATAPVGGPAPPGSIAIEEMSRGLSNSIAPGDLLDY